MKKQKILLIPMLGLALVTSSCSKGGIFGGVLGSLSLGNINAPSGFSSYNPPVNSKMTESKSNLTGANNDVVLTLMALRGFTTKQELINSLSSSDPADIAFRELLSAHEIIIDDGQCSTDDSNLIVSDGSMSKTLEETYVKPDNLVVCPYNVSASIKNVKDSLDSESMSSSYSALSTGNNSSVKNAEKSLVQFLYDQGGSVDCSGGGTFPNLSGGTYNLSDYSEQCNFYKTSSLVNGSANGDSYKIYQRLHQKYELETSLELTVLGLMSEDEANPEFKNYAEQRLSSDPVLKTKMANHAKKDALDEFLQVSLNSFMSHGVNIFSLFTYLGYDVSEEGSGFTGADKEKLEQLYTDNAFKIVTTDKAKSNFFFTYKPGFRFFVDMFIDGKIDAYDNSGNKILEDEASLDAMKNAKLFRYYPNPTNLCKYILTTSSNGDSGEINTESLSECLDTVTPFIDRLIVMHDMDTKLISFYYSDPGRLAQTKFLDFSYNYNYQIDMRIDSNNFKNVAIAVLERELVDHPALMQDQNVEQSDIDFLKNIEISGKVFLSDKIKVGLDLDNRVSLADIGLSDLDSKVTIGAGDFLSSSTEGFYLKIPEDLGDFSVGSNNNNVSMDSETEGDVILTLPKSRDLFYMEHQRGNDIYKDKIGINIPDLFLQFPPYQLSEQDLLIAYLGLDQLCDPSLAPAGYTCDAQFQLVKPQFTSGDVDRLGKLHLKKFDVDTVLGTMTSNFKEWGIGITPVSAKFNAPTVDKVINSGTRRQREAQSIEVSSASVWAKLRNQDTEFGDSNIPLTIAPYVDGVTEFQMSMVGPINFDLSSGNIIMSNNTPPSMTLDYVHMDLIDADGVHKLINNCSLPLPLGNHIVNDNDGNPTETVSSENALGAVLEGVLSEAYPGYTCN